MPVLNLPVLSLPRRQARFVPRMLLWASLFWISGPGDAGATPADSMLDAHRSEINACYAQTLLVEPAAAGTLAWEITLGKGGAVVSIKVTETFSASLSSCVSSLFSRHLFSGAEGAHFSQRLSLSPGDVSAAELILAAATQLSGQPAALREVATRSQVVLLNDDARYQALEQAVSATAPSWRSCAGTAAAGQPAGYLQFRLDAEGKVEWAMYQAADRHDTTAGGCVEAHFREVRLGGAPGQYGWVVR